MRIFLSVLFILTLSLLFAGNPPKADVFTQSDDAMEEMDTGQLRLYFFNAINGNPIKGATVNLEGIGDLETDFQGKVEFEPLEDEYMQKITFTNPEYITSEFEIEINAGTLFFNRFSISPVMAINQFRVVLDWSKKPKDLDANFRKSGSYTISYRGMKTLQDGSGRLDRDDRDGFGPETITVDKIATDAQYEFFVEDYDNKGESGSKALSKSKAHVSVYGNGRLLNSFFVPLNSKGTKWQVFKIEQGQIIPVNTLN